MTNIPYTYAASDFMKYTSFKDDQKESLIDYTSTDFLSLRDSLIDYIKAVYPLDYGLFAESDLGMMLVEVVAYMGSVMSMKTDMIAHEMFLKTVKSPANLRKIFEIIGVRLRGPGSAAAKASVTSETAVASEITIPEASRVFEATSNLDGSPVNYTLYKTTNGIIEDPSTSNDIVLYTSESEGDTGLVWENLVLAEGSLSIDTGVFSDVDVLKQITLENGPVVDGSIQVYISDAGDYGGTYREVTSLLSTSSSDLKVFQVAYTDDFIATLQFGDGITAVMPPTNSTYTITYRVGGGQRGNAPSNFINASINTLEGSSVNVVNTNPLTGGLEAETIDQAKKYAKFVYRQQDRLVSLDDYLTFVNNYRNSLGQACKASVTTRKAFSSSNIIDIYLLQKASTNQFEKASLSFKRDLLEAMEPKKMLTDEVVLVDGLIRTLDLDIRLTVDREFESRETDILLRTSKTISEYFSVDSREFAEVFSPSDITREIFTNVDEVRLAEVMNFSEPITLEINEILQLNNFNLTVNYV